MMARRYTTPPAFKQALEKRLRSASASGEDFARRRQLLVFDRFLDRLQEAGRLDLADFMRFEVHSDRHHPEIDGEGMRYDGYRFRVECRLAGKLYGRPFGVDVGFGDPLTQEPDMVVTDDVLAFAGIEPPTVRLYPVVSHIAEKLHAYTLPRPRLNSRVKDLPDLALLGSTGPLDVEVLRGALEKTFDFRETHPLPQSLASPPSFWEQPYAAMAEADDLHWRALGDLYGAVAAFLDPVLGPEVGRRIWDPEGWLWRAP